LAPVFSSTLICKKTLFLKIRLSVDPKPKDPTAAGRLQLKELGKLMINLDPTMIFYKYKQTYKDKRDAWNKLSQLRTMIMGIQLYMNGFRPTPKGGDLWGNTRIGINSNATEFLANASQGPT
jgi:hypothetical protein